MPKTCPAADDVMSNLHLSGLVLSGDDPSICSYLLNGNKAAPVVVITFNSAPGITASAVQQGLVSGQTNVATVADLADAAFSFGGSDGGTGLTFLSGDTVCSILVLLPSSTAAEASLARSILDG